ncbi:MAG: M55 family metallopeptidase [Candidatus Eremiobacteraeota bacterium]|nr:M55 family metallopeptidase [Candidatus Eremiobacteraeota bacterium]
MKLYVSCDMEGTAGVCSWEQVDARGYNREYFAYQRYMTHEVRAAIEGAREAGVTDVLVNDSHGPMRNLLFDELPSDIRVIFGNRKPFSMVQGVDDCDGVFFTGYHAAIGTENGTLAHTYSPGCIYDARINGVRCSEATLNAGLAGHYGVPVLLVTGDRVTIDEVTEQMPWVTGVVVKNGIGHHSVDSLAPVAAQRLIRAGAADAVRNATRAKPYVFAAPITLEIDVTRVEQADLIELIPGFERVAGRTVRLVHDDYPTVFKAFVAAFRMGALAL